jgi:pectate lyase
MKKLKIILVCFSMLAMSMSQCGDDEVTPSHKSCFSGEPVKTVKDQKGTVYYSPEEKQYYVQVSISGYDSMDIGFICDNLDILKKEGLKITFDGNYLPYKADRKPTVPVGTECYFLDINKFEINRDL